MIGARGLSRAAVAPALPARCLHCGLCRPPGTTGAPVSHRESRHVPPLTGSRHTETGQGLPLVIAADTTAGAMGTEPPPAARDGALRGTGQAGVAPFHVLGQTWLLHGPPELRALSPSQCLCQRCRGRRSQWHRDILGAAAQAQESRGGPCSPQQPERSNPPYSVRTMDCNTLTLERCDGESSGLGKPNSQRPERWNWDRDWDEMGIGWAWVRRWGWGWRWGCAWA